MLVHPSRAEGAANVIGEAVTLGVPVLASRIPGNVGLLGARHPGLFPVGDARALRALLLRAEEDSAFYRRLERATVARAPLFEPVREREAWRRLVAELFRP